MSKRKSKPNGKHLTEDDRGFIAEALQGGSTFKAIAAQLGKDPTTVAKEVKTNRTFKMAGTFVDNTPNLCAHRKSCGEAYICPPDRRGRHCAYGCRKCDLCNELCGKFEKEECPKLARAPFVCNGCGKKTSCRLEKFYYRAVTAQRMYVRRLSTSRMGINIGEEECAELDNFITPLIKRGQPVSHIFNSFPGRVPCSKSTLYRYVNSGVLSLKNIDMRSVVRYRPRKNKPTPKDTGARKGRTYLDFLDFVAANPDAHVWEMDVVEGRKGGKVILSLFSRETKLMLLYLMERNAQEDVLAVLDDLEQQIGTAPFFRIFHVVLTDNGSSLLNANELETSSLNPKRRLYLFYCDPYSAFQKGGIEKNHEYIRWVLPQGTSFDNLSWHDVATLASHINSVARDSLDGLTPYSAMKSLHPSLLDKVCVSPIPPADVNLTPGLLK
jgi:IS30 family transposase